MKEYRCETCNYTSDRYYNLTKHLRTKSHKLNEEKKRVATESSKMKGNFSENTEKNGKNQHKVAKHTEKNGKIQHKIAEKVAQKVRVLSCKYCEKEFILRDSYTRHIKNHCKVKKEQENKIRLIEEKHDLEKEKLYEQIDKLLEKVGTTHITNHNTLDNRTTTNNTTNNHNSITSIQNTQNIHLNNFGEENMEALPNTFMTHMVKYPFTAIPCIIKKKHFNSAFPENMNIRILNKKDNKLQVRNNNKWEYVNKRKTFKKLIESSNDHLEGHYDDIKEDLDKKYKDRYGKYQNKYMKSDINLFNDFNEEIELALWNSMIE